MKQKANSSRETGWPPTWKAWKSPGKLGKLREIVLCGCCDITLVTNKINMT